MSVFFRFIETALAVCARPRLSEVATLVLLLHTHAACQSIMAVDSNDSEQLRKCQVPDFPAEHVLAHEGAEWMKSAFAALAVARLAVTAEIAERWH